MRATSLRILATVAIGGTLIACGSNSGGKSPAAATGPAAAASGTPGTLATPAVATPKLGGTLTIGIKADAVNFDTAKSKDLYSGYVQGMVLEPLFIEAPDTTGGFQVTGDLVEKVETPDPTTYLWHLRQGIAFQDGTAFNADAVKWNLQRHLDDKSSVVHGAVAAISDMTVMDPYTLKVTLAAPNGAFLANLTTGAGFMYSPAQFQKVGPDAAAKDLTGLGSGPFTFGAWQHGVQIELDRNPTYWQKDANGVQYPYLDKVLLKPVPDENTREIGLKTGDLDAIEAPPPKDIKALQGNTDLTYKQLPGLSFDYIELNAAKPPFDNVLVRQALSYAIDRQQIADTVYFGTHIAADSEIPATLAGSRPGPYLKRDVAKAKSLLQQAGAASVPFALQFAAGVPVAQQTAELIKDEASEAGIEIALQPIDFATLLDNSVKGNYQGGLLSWNGVDDPDAFVSPVFKTGAPFNTLHYASPALDAALVQAQRLTDASARAPLYQQIEQTLAADEPAIVYDWGIFQQASRRAAHNWQVGPAAYKDLYMVWKG